MPGSTIPIFLKFEMLLLCWPDKCVKTLVKRLRCQLIYQDIGWQAKTLVDRPRHWLTGQDIGWQAKILVDRLRYWLTGQDIGWQAERLVDRLRSWLTDQNIGWQAKTLVDGPRHWLTHHNTDWRTKKQQARLWAHYLCTYVVCSSFNSIITEFWWQITSVEGTQQHIL